MVGTAQAGRPLVAAQTPALAPAVDLPTLPSPAAHAAGRVWTHSGVMAGMGHSEVTSTKTHRTNSGRARQPISPLLPPEEGRYVESRVAFVLFGRARLIAGCV